MSNQPVAELQNHQMPTFKLGGKPMRWRVKEWRIRINLATLFATITIVMVAVLLFWGWLFEPIYSVLSNWFNSIGLKLYPHAYLLLVSIPQFLILYWGYRAVRHPLILLWFASHRSQRYNRLLTRRSDYVTPNEFNRTLDQRIRFFRSYENRWFWVLLCLVTGGVLTPLGLHYLVNILPVPTNLRSFIEWGALRIEVPNDIWTLTPLQLMLVGLVSTAILLIVYFLYYVRRVSPRAIIAEFKAHTIDNAYTSYMNTVATTSRRLLYEELRRVAELLQRNQIENIHFVPEDTNAIIMTSGIETELFNTLQSVVTVEVANTNSTIDLGRLYAFFTRSLATILINGGVQRHDNGSTEIFVEMRYRNRAAAAAKVVIESSAITEMIDDSVIKQKIRELVMRLLVELGQVPGTGRSWQSLDHFMEGLAASGRKSWWVAISQYHRALEQCGDSGAQSLGVVYYHLGAAYINQQLWDEGKKMLLQAERYGPPMAETQYMLALYALNLYWGALHKSTPAFDEICYRCHQALQMKPGFAAAHQLLGMVYYRRGRVIERDSTKTSVAQKDYKEALLHFKRALLSYDHRLDSLRRSPSNNHVNLDTTALMRQRMASAHQIGDALRGLRRHVEASRFYADMEVIEPSNLRNVADTLKNYTLAGWYSKVYKTFVKHQMRRPEVRWDSDIAVHVGWALMEAATRNSQGHRELVLEAFQYLDYALYTRPRISRPWTQTEWDKPVKKIFEAFEQQTERLTIHQPFYTRGICQSTTEFCDESYYPENYLYVDFALKYRRYLLTQQGLSESETEILLSLLGRSEVDEFKCIVDEIIKLESNNVSDNRYLDMLQYYIVADVAKRADALLNKCERYTKPSCTNHYYNLLIYLDTVAAKTSPFTLVSRIQLDFYLIVSLLTARALAEARRFEPLCALAKKVTEQLANHRKQWQEYFKFAPGGYNNRPHFTFSVLVFRYQYASMLAWYAYGLFMRDADLVSMQISNHIRKQAKYAGLSADRDQSIKRAKEVIDEAHRLLPIHPLIMYVRARLFAHDRLYNEAIIELQRLMDVISPYDPKTDVGVVSADNVQTQATTSEERQRLYHLERIIGRQQFINIVQPARVLELMAAYAEMLGDLPQAVVYLNDAVRRSPYHDKDFYLFERLASQSNQLERYADSRAIAEAMKIPRERFDSTVTSMGVFRLAPEILELQALTRQGKHEKARQLSRRIAYDFSLNITQAGPSAPSECDADLKEINSVSIELNDYLEVASRLAQVFGCKVSAKSSFLTNLMRIIVHLRKRSDVADKDDRRRIFSDVFANIPVKDTTNLNTIAQRLLFVQNREAINTLIGNKNDDEYELAKLMHTAMHIGQEARSILIYLGDLFNSMAYNRVMLRQVESIHPLIDAACAVYIFTYMYQTCDYQEPKRGVLSRKLAQSLDTYAWVVYNMGIETDDTLISKASGRRNVLEHTRHLLLFAQRYDASRAIVHYHLAHVYLDLAQEAIDNQFATSQDLRNHPSKYLEQAQQVIDSARHYDHSGRLSHRLDQLLMRCNMVKARVRTHAS